MRHTAIVCAVMAAAALAGCDRLQPAKPADVASADATSPTLFEDNLAENRKDEAPLFKGHESEIARNGHVLTLSANGKPVATFTDNDAYQWVLTGSFQQADSKGGRKTYFLVSQLKLGTDSTTYNLVVSGDGEPIDWVMDGVVVFDGPLLASGLGGSLDMGGPEIDDWTQTPRQRFTFNSPCQPEKWLNATTVVAQCPGGDGAPEGSDSEVLITRLSASEWQLREKPEAYAVVKAAYAKANRPARPAFNERAQGVADKPWDSEGLKELADSGFRKLP